jgi:hypothetical protein
VLGTIEEEKGGIERVNTIADATPLQYGDALYIRGQVAQRWPAINWRIDPYLGRYLIVGTQE